MRFFAALAASAVLFDSAAATAWLPTRTVVNEARSNTPPSSPFVTVQGANFMKDGKPMKFSVADAYWLSQLTDENINTTLKDIASKNITVVRAWAFNDVSEVPETGAWFQLLAKNGTRIFNNGTNGVQRLRVIADIAQENNLTVQFVLTNNWSANNISNITVTLANGTKVNSPRGSYSNGYGGSDAYVMFNNGSDHGEFFTNQTIISTFMDGLTDLIPQFANHKAILSWEIANDPRCNGTLSNPDLAGQCTTTSVTLWHQQISAHVKSLDPNHLVASGSQGFMCQVPSTTVCPKFFFTQAPAPVTSPAPGLRRRSLTEKSIIAERNARWKRTAAAAKQQQDNAVEKRARGVFDRWVPRSLFGREAAADPVPVQVKKRQSMTLGPSMDGSFGVDSLDIGAIPNISYLTTQFFPDQNVYEPPDPSLSSLNNTINAAIQWFSAQAAISRMVDKPVFLTGFGLVSLDNAPFFIPFNGTSLTFPNASAIPTTPIGPQVGVLQGQAPVNDSTQALAYQSILEAAIANSFSAITVHQWGQGNLQPAPPTPTQAISNAPSGVFVPDLPATQGSSPNDGYQAISPQIQAVVQAAAINLQLANEISIPQFAAVTPLLDTVNDIYML
ncbi:hypothetical protein Clacol_006625 [Clathrus columnatus]|uniref:mannan endo-1,4-beta-mannosidase n=1 Tax=Clathrus columnatus TaxID=1419009 RepID=A0AAV5AGX9_9AGAM|nr:hypothetical protein Clacol_006625 [Clathrus columnatus]